MLHQQKIYLYKVEISQADVPLKQRQNNGWYHESVEPTLHEKSHLGLSSINAFIEIFEDISIHKQRFRVLCQ